VKQWLKGLFYEDRPERLTELTSSADIRDFVGDYYAADIALYESVRTCARQRFAA
jgi:hypothetical protein